MADNPPQQDTCGTNQGESSWQVAGTKELKPTPMIHYIYGFWSNIHRTCFVEYLTTLTLSKWRCHFNLITIFQFFISLMCFVGNIKAFEGWILCCCEQKHILEMSWMGLSALSCSCFQACSSIMKGGRTHTLLFKHWIHQKIRICQYVSPPSR